MTKKEAIAEFKRLYPREMFMTEFGGPVAGKKQFDSISRDECWCDFTDSLCKDGRITQHQDSTWTHPFK